MKNPILSGEISMESKLPLHYQLMMIIKRNISSHNLNPGDQLPTEDELCKAYDVSRSTVRNALASLEEDGLINRVRGKGTFISKTKMKRKMEQVYSFTHQMQAMGLNPTSQIVEFETIPSSDDFVKLFDLEPGERVYRIVRLRKANEEPMLLETSYMPVRIYPGLTEEKLHNTSLYDLLRDDAKVVPFKAEETYESVIFKDNIANMLECPIGSSGFYIERVTQMDSGETYELTQAFMRGDKSKLMVTLNQDMFTVNKGIG